MKTKKSPPHGEKAPPPSHKEKKVAKTSPHGVKVWRKK